MVEQLIADEFWDRVVKLAAEDPKIVDYLSRLAVRASEVPVEEVYDINAHLRHAYGMSDDDIQKAIRLGIKRVAAEKYGNDEA